MHELGRFRRSAARQVVHLAEEHRIAAADGVAGDAATVDAAPDDRQVEYPVGGLIDCLAHDSCPAVAGNPRLRPSMNSEQPFGVCTAAATPIAFFPSAVATRRPSSSRSLRRTCVRRACVETSNRRVRSSTVTRPDIRAGFRMFDWRWLIPVTIHLKAERPHGDRVADGGQPAQGTRRVCARRDGSVVKPLAAAVFLHNTLRRAPHPSACGIPGLPARRISAPRRRSDIPSCPAPRCPPSGFRPR